ncbi:hypothetical protein DICVIV_11980, partial [Dictyocaulus viviparus]
MRGRVSVLNRYYNLYMKKAVLFQSAKNCKRKKKIASFEFAKINSPGACISSLTNVLSKAYQAYLTFKLQDTTRMIRTLDIGHLELSLLKSYRLDSHSTPQIYYDEDTHNWSVTEENSSKRKTRRTIILKSFEGSKRMSTVHQQFIGEHSRYTLSASLRMWGNKEKSDPLLLGNFGMGNGFHHHQQHLYQHLQRGTASKTARPVVLWKGETARKKRFEHRKTE